MTAPVIILAANDVIDIYVPDNSEGIQAEFLNMSGPPGPAGPIGQQGPQGLPADQIPIDGGNF
jgi:hypothetical protein